MNDFPLEEHPVELTAEGFIRWVAGQETPLWFLFATNESLQVSSPRVGRIISVDRAGVNFLQYRGAHRLRFSQTNEKVSELGIFIPV
jgi:hypothetical protein